MKLDLSPSPLELRLCKTPRSEDMVLTGVWTGLLREDAHCTGTEANVAGKGSSIRTWGTELDVSRLGHEGWDCTGSFRGP